MAKILYFFKGNGNLRINNIVRSNLFLLLNLCFEHQMFFCAYFHDCLVYLLEDLLVYYSLQSTARLDIKSVIV